MSDRKPNDFNSTISAHHKLKAKEPSQTSSTVSEQVQKVQENQNESLSPSQVTTRQNKLKAMFSRTKPEEKYHNCGELARGGMGVVYSIMEKSLHRGLVMKVLMPTSDVEDHKRNIDFFIEEGRITAQLEHPNIVPVHDIGLLEDGNVFFTMKHVKGESLSQIIEHLTNGDVDYTRKYSLYHRLSIFRRVCDAIAFGHSRQVVHRDIKPENIMIGEYGEVLTLDWGLAKFIGTQMPSNITDHSKVYSLRLYKDFSKTIDGLIQGTPRYFSPEQTFADSSLIDPRSDIYLLGATLYHFLTLEFPHDGQDIEDLIDKVQRGNIIPPEQTNYGKQIPIQICNIIKKAMAVRKEDRYQTVEEMSQELDSFLEGEISCAPLQFRKGEFLIRTGEVGHEGYVILSGNVKVFAEINDKEIVFAHMGPGDIVGEMAIISSQKRSANVRATKDTEVLVIDRDRISEILKRLPPWMEKIVMNLVDRLRIANDNIHPLKMESSIAHTLIQLTFLVTHKAYQGQQNIRDLKFTPSYLLDQIGNLLSLPVESLQKQWDTILESGLFARENDNIIVNDLDVLSATARICAEKTGVASPLLDILPATLDDKKEQAQKIAYFILTKE